MALAAQSIIDVRATGSDTANGGTFNPAATFDATGAIASANTSAPVLTVSGVTFPASGWVFLKSGTNVIPGFYPIASGGSGTCTLNAAIGAAILYTNSAPSGLNTVAGCSASASLTSISWGVDYSQQDAPGYSLTGLTTSAANAIILTSSASKDMIGNGVIITGGTNFITGYYQITAVSAGTSITVDRTCTSAAGALGTAAIGGGLASPGMAAGVAVASNIIFLLYNASVYSITSASTNISGGCLALPGSVNIIGYNTNRHVNNTDALKPTIQLNVSTATMFVGNAAFISGGVINIICDGNTQTAAKLHGGNNAQVFQYCTLKNFTAASSTNQGSYTGCIVTGNSAAVCIASTYYCDVFGNTATPIVINNNNSGSCIGNLVHNNTGASTDGINMTSGNGSGIIAGNTSYGNGRNGIATSGVSICINNISESNGGVGITGALRGYNNATYNNTGGATSGTQLSGTNTLIQYSGSAFVNAASGNFALNNTAGAGALLRASGFPALFPAGLTASYADIGAAQHQDSGGGGASIFRYPDMAGGMVG